MGRSGPLDVTSRTPYIAGLRNFSGQINLPEELIFLLFWKSRRLVWFGLVLSFREITSCKLHLSQNFQLSLHINMTQN